MKTLASYIADKTPKFNRVMVEGLGYHRFKRVLNYLDEYIKFTANSKTNTHLRYLGYKEVDYNDEFKRIFSKNGKIEYDIAKNNIFLVDFLFQYGSEANIRKYSFYVPYIEKGNILTLSGNNFLAMPILSDKVVSIGENVIFVNILTAKYNFYRGFYTININNKLQRVPIIYTELYKNQSKKLEDTTKALTTIMHYMLANYGFTRVCKELLGFVPKVTYENIKDEKYVCVTTCGVKPQGYILKEEYIPTNIKILVPKENFNEHVAYVLGNIFYIIDNFSTSITITDLDNDFVWKRLLGEIIHSGNHQIGYIMEKMNAHFNDINSAFDTITINKLKDINIDAMNLSDLLMIIFNNYNKWILSENSKSLYFNKTYEIENYVLSKITYRITKAFLDISKEELRLNNQELEEKVVSKILDKYFTPRIIFSIKKETLYLTSIEYCGDHLYPKNTAMVVVQESDPINITTTTNVSIERKKVHASHVTVGNILGLPKKNPVPIVRLNPYVNVDEKTGTILPHEQYKDIIDKTEKLLLNNVFDEDLETEALLEIEDNYEDTSDTESSSSIMEDIEID